MLVPIAKNEGDPVSVIAAGDDKCLYRRRLDEAAGADARYVSAGHGRSGVRGSVNADLDFQLSGTRP
jgi:hypothetical protein